LPALGTPSNATQIRADRFRRVHLVSIDLAHD
jgi:hypothetical protein